MADKMKILVSDDVSEKGVALLREKGYQVDVKTNLDEVGLIDCIGDYDGLITRSMTHVTADVIAAAKKLKIIGRAGVGIDSIDLKEDAAARARVSALGAPYAWVETLDDPRLDAFARLTEVQLRNKLEPEKGVFIAESIKVIDRALDAGMVPVSVLMTPEWLDAAAPTVARI